MLELNAISNQVLGIGLGVSMSEYRYLQRQNANLLAIADIYGRVSGAQDVVYDIFEGDNDYSAGHLDTTRTTAKQALTIGTTVLTDKINAITGPGFKVGQEITVFDDVNMERPRVTVAGTEIVTTTIDRTTPVAVATGASLIPSFKSRPMKLTNGWLITVSAIGGGSVQVHKSEDNGATWSLLTTWSGVFASNYCSAASFGNTVFLASADLNASSVNFTSFDATTVGSTVTSKSTSALSGQIVFSSVSLAVKSETELTIFASTANSTYQNSYNIISQKTTNGGTNWTKQDGTAGIDQLTTYNSSGDGSRDSYSTYNPNGYPCEVHTFNTGSGYRYVYCYYYTGTSWASSIVLTASYTQSEPSITIQTTGANIGRLWLAWHGLDATTPSIYNIYCKYSDDGGANWTAAGVTGAKVTSDTAYSQLSPSVTTDANGDVFILYEGVDTAVTASYRNIKRIKRTNGTWGSSTTITSETSNHAMYPRVCDNFKTNDLPLTVYKQSSTNTIKFTGKWTVQTVNSTLETTALTKAYKKNAVIARSTVTVDNVGHEMNFGDFIEDGVGNKKVLFADARYNIVGKTGQAYGLVAWVDYEKDAGMSVDCKMSTQNVGENEVMQNLTSFAPSEIETGIMEQQFMGSASKKNLMTMRVTMARTVTTVDKSVKKILGAVS